MAIFEIKSVVEAALTVDIRMGDQVFRKTIHLTPEDMLQSSEQEMVQVSDQEMVQDPEQEVIQGEVVDRKKAKCKITPMSQILMPPLVSAQETADTAIPKKFGDLDLAQIVSMREAGKSVYAIANHFRRPWHLIKAALEYVVSTGNTGNTTKVSPLPNNKKARKFAPGSKCMNNVIRLRNKGKSFREICMHYKISEHTLKKYYELVTKDAAKGELQSFSAAAYKEEEIPTPKTGKYLRCIPVDKFQPVYPVAPFQGNIQDI